MKVIRLARAAWDVLLLADDRGRCEALDVMQELEDQGGRGMLALLRTQVAKYGPPKNNPSLCAYVEDDIWEFRKGAVRLFWFYDKGQVVVGAWAYKKQTQKAPRRHIEKAKNRREEYFGSKQKGPLKVVDHTDWE